MARVLRTVGATGRAFMQHCQDPALTRGGVMNAGALATRLALGGWPAAAEENILERDVQLNRRVGCRYHAQHVSSGGSVEIVRRARAEDQPVTAEVTPHHLLLTEDLCRDYDTVAKVNPPLRVAMVSEEWYKRLSAADRKVFDEGVAKAAAANRAWVGPSDSAAIAQLEKAGITVTRLTPEARARFRDLSRPVWTALLTSQEIQPFIDAAEKTRQ